MSKSALKRVVLNPVAGYVVKTTCQEPGIYTPSAITHTPAPPPGTLEPSGPTLKSTPVTKGLKVFLNVASDANVPAPPSATEAEIRKAMAGDSTNTYFVPVIVSDGRESTDKAGKLSLVFDSIFNTAVLERASKDVPFKTYITEIALERVEEKSGLSLAREISSPNIKSKGPLASRSVYVPSYGAPAASSSKSPLIQEITPETTPKPAPEAPRSILKPSSSNGKPPSAKVVPAPTTPTPPTPKWELEFESPTPSSRTARIAIQIPHLTREHYPQTALDLEPRRLILTFAAGAPYTTLDVPLFPTVAAGKKEIQLDVDSANAEWRVGEGVLVVSAKLK